jgi:oxidase EvaA
MEPGNINKVQLSPTVQATESNYTRVHGGKAIKYLNFFKNKNQKKILVK